MAGMAFISRAALNGSAKIVAGALVLIGIIRLIDFALYGRRLDHLLAGLGFCLMAFGTFTNGFVTEDRSRPGRYVAGAGALLAITSVLVQAAG
jgi:hypothetical protein